MQKAQIVASHQERNIMNEKVGRWPLPSIHLITHSHADVIMAGTKIVVTPAYCQPPIDRLSHLSCSEPFFCVSTSDRSASSVEIVEAFVLGFPVPQQSRESDHV
jgi:hypothetical protein